MLRVINHAIFKKHLVYPGQSRDVREILRHPIGCLEDWALERLLFHGKSKPRIGVFATKYMFFFVLCGRGREMFEIIDC